jgi:hypothetical protein
LNARTQRSDPLLVTSKNRKEDADDAGILLTLNTAPERKGEILCSSSSKTETVFLCVHLRLVLSAVICVLSAFLSAFYLRSICVLSAFYLRSICVLSASHLRSPHIFANGGARAHP